jgi:histidyl-tRNA synthetase
LKPSIPKGTRDFSPLEMNRRNYIFDTIKKVFQKYGYQQIETPAMENLKTLTGKYGEEGDKLIYKIRSNKNLLERYPELRDCKCLKETYPYDWIPMASDKALRYDLTIPFARYVVMHQNEITFPFKRFQFQPVWRADNPQKGRYREFFQCDADVIGSDSLLNEIDLLLIIDEVFTALNIKVTIKINNRKIISGIAESIGTPERMVEIATAIDKYDKIGEEGIKLELSQKNFSPDQISKIFEIILMEQGKINYLGIAQKQDINLNKLNFLKNGSNVRDSIIIQKGIKETEEILFALTNINNKINFDLKLARGLNYYTGAILEVVANDPKSTFTSSICGGGRYDDLTGVFGLPNVSGVGISFGVDRIYDVLEEIGFPEINNIDSTQVLIYNYFSKDQSVYLDLINKIRAAGINAELYPDPADKGNSNKLQKKQFEYAKSKNIPFTIAIEEINNWKPVVKNVANKTTKILEFESFIEDLKLFMDSNK